MQFKRPVRQCKPDSQNQLIEPESRLGVTRSTFFYATPKLWNDAISPSHANAPSVVMYILCIYGEGGTLV